MATVLRQRNFSLLWLGGLISMIGNWMLLAALPFYVFDLTGSALATSGILIAYFAPGILFGSLAGVFVDRWDRKRTMVVTSFMQAAVIAVLLLVRSSEWMWLIYVVVLAEATLRQFFSPAENALLPRLVGEENLMAANSLNALNDNIGRLVGPAIGGALLGLVGFSSVVIIDAVTYLAAAALIMLVRAPTSAPRPTEEVAEADGGFAQVWKEWLAGLRLIRGSSILTSTFLIVSFAMFGDAIISAILVVFVQTDMALNPVQFGWLMSARGVGGLLGALLAAQLAGKLPPGHFVAAGLFASGLLLAVGINIPTLAILLPLLVLVGITALIAMVGIQTILQTGTEDAYRGRVFGAFGTTSMLLMVIGSGLAGGLADQVGASTLLNGGAGIYVIAGLLAAVLIARPARQAVTAAGNLR